MLLDRAAMAKSHTARRRIEEGMREVGILLIAFAPLDAVLAERPAVGVLLFFLLLGIALFTTALVLEWRREHDR